MCAVLYDAANSFIHQHFVEVSMSEEFLALPFEDVLELVSRDELNVKSEEQVCVWAQRSAEPLVSLEDEAEGIGKRSLLPAQDFSGAFCS